MADPEKLRIFVRYSDLYLAELRALLSDVERCYNKLDAFLRHSQRIRRARRLKILSLQTGNSVEIVLVGSAVTLSALAALIDRVSASRKRFWEAEESKWKAKLRRREYERGTNSPEALIADGARREIHEITDSVKILETRIERIERSKSIDSVEIGSEDE